MASEEAAGSQGGPLKPVLLVIAGPNGAGKTTVTGRLRSEQTHQGYRDAGRSPAKALYDLIASQWLLPPISDAPREVPPAS